MSLTQYSTATALDGYIADSDNSLDWLFTRKREEDGPLNYGEFIARVGAMAMGSTSSRWVGAAPLLPRRIELRLEELGRNVDFACARFSVVRPA